ncbi:hypothetical protein NL676_037603 [Syzygium grande]|nr:hypothetical protein NL676_037603 [Syzygium grande]
MPTKLLSLFSFLHLFIYFWLVVLLILDPELGKVPRHEETKTVGRRGGRVAVLDHTLRGGAVIGFLPRIARSRTVDSSATRRSTLAIADSKNSWREDLGVTCRAHVISALGEKSWRDHELVPALEKVPNIP